MPWTVESPPSCAKNWTDAEKKKCVAAGNARLRDGGSDEDAIFACIHAAGKSKGQKAMGDELSAKVTVKAVGDDEGDWALDILAAPFGSETNRDTQKQWFDQETNFQEDRYPTPPIVFYHGMTDGLRAKKDTPEYLGMTIKRWVDAAGVWVKTILDKATPSARQVWDAAKKGLARASSGTAEHLQRTDDNGYIREWPIVEVSVFDMTAGRQPVNKYAVAIPSVKALYEKAGIELPRELEDPEAGPKAVKAAVLAGAKADVSNLTEDKHDMEKQEVQELVGTAIAEALKAQADATAVAAVKAEEDAVAEAAKIKAVKEEAVEAYKKELAVKANRLHSPGEGVIIARYGDTRRYDNLDVGEHALLVQMLESAQFVRLGNKRATDACMKALALKIESEAEKSEAANLANFALKALPIKANEINRTTLTSYGDEWIGVAYSHDLWAKIRSGAWVMDRLMSKGRVVSIPDGFESGVIPLESADPTWYKIAQGSTATSGRPDVTATASKVGTGQQTIDIVKMACRVMYTGEMTEDSLIRWITQARRQIVESGQEQFDHAIINGDTETGASTNINDIAGTPAATEVFMLVNGFRKLPLITNTANATSGGALADTDFLDVVKLLGGAGKNARDQAAVTLIVDGNVYWKALEMATVKTKDVWQNATLESGKLTGIWGFELKPSWMMHFDESGVITAAYELKVNSAGKLDIDTNTNNTKGAILAVRWDQWAIAWKRRMTLETSRWPESDTNQIVAIARWGLAYRDTEASAISYNLTV